MTPTGPVSGGGELKAYLILQRQHQLAASKLANPREEHHPASETHAIGRLFTREAREGRGVGGPAAAMTEILAAGLAPSRSVSLSTFGQRIAASWEPFAWRIGWER